MDLDTNLQKKKLINFHSFMEKRLCTSLGKQHFNVTYYPLYDWNCYQQWHHHFIFQFTCQSKVNRAEIWTLQLQLFKIYKQLNIHFYNLLSYAVSLSVFFRSLITLLYTCSWVPYVHLAIEHHIPYVCYHLQWYIQKNKN